MATGYTGVSVGHRYVFSISLFLSYTTPHPQIDIIQPLESNLNTSPLCETHIASLAFRE